MTRILGTLLTLFMATSFISAQQTEAKHRIFTGGGESSSLEAIIKAAEASDAVFLGEFHDDAVGHRFQLEVFEAAIREIGAKRPVALSLEMFERDVQTVLDEYLAGLISEDHFLRSSRPWPQYKTDYRPLVELAKQNKLAVIAANAPRRYVNMVARLGRGSLDKLSPEAKTWLPPLPFAEPSEAYSKKFNALMGRIHDPNEAPSSILYSQTLWDAAMAHAVAEAIKAKKGTLVVHLNGGFHNESRLGTVEHLFKYKPDAKAVVVTIRYEEDFNKFDPEKHKDLGDFVVLTDAAQPRSGK